MKTVDQLERQERARRRASGENLHIEKFDFGPEVENYLFLRQVSRSEYLRELLISDKSKRARHLSVKREEVVA